jgi:hypothetical protein
VLCQHDNYGFSAPVVFRSKTQCAGKDHSFACEARLAVNVDKLTELAIIMLKEHWELS